MLEGQPDLDVLRADDPRLPPPIAAGVLLRFTGLFGTGAELRTAIAAGLLIVFVCQSIALVLGLVILWQVEGVPPNPGAWLTTTANRKAIDRIRREHKRDGKQQEAQALFDDVPTAPPGVIDDERLRLIFTCCHPALAMETRVALTLRMVGGLTVPEIARAFYDQLARVDPSPIVTLNRAIAIAELDGPQVALAAVDRLGDELAGYHAYHATRADLLRRLGATEEARAAYDKAIELAGNTAETAYLTRRRAELA